MFFGISVLQTGCTNYLNFSLNYHLLPSRGRGLHLSEAIRVTEGVSGDAVILLLLSYVSTYWMYVCVCLVTVGMDEFCVLMAIFRQLII